MAETKINRKNNNKNRIDFRYNLNLYLNFLKKYNGLFIGLLSLILIIEGSYVIDKFLFKIIIDRGTEFSAGTLATNNFVNMLLVIAGVYATIAITRAFLKFIHLHATNRLEANMIVDLKRKFFNHLIHLDHNFHTTHKTGSLISRLVRCGGAVERMTDVIVFNFAPLVFQSIVVTASLVYFSWVPAIITILTVVSFVLYSFYIQKIQEEANIIVNNMDDREKANISDIFTNIDSIKYFGKEDDVKARFKKISEATKKALLKHWDYFRWMDFGQALILSVGTFFLVYFPLVDFLNGKSSIGTLVFIYTVEGMLTGPLFGFVHGIRNFYRSMADFEVLFQYNKIESEVKDKPHAKLLDIKHGEIEFRNVEFKYGKRTLFKHFNLKIHKNKKIALVGHSGCGKTTLVKLLYRMYDVDSGQILIDGKDIRDFKQESLRGEMSTVPQECVLFDDTVYNNVRFSKPDASRKEVMRAMRFAQLDRIVKSFPRKENTIVGERGVRLSGGEKQRVSIARAILADKKVLVLDEATSSLDSRTEHEIQRDLQKLMEDRTSIIIAHRLSTIMKADMIIVMDNGKIVQMGRHKDLIKQPGEYKELWNLQKGGYIK